jgi:hypothetical protein
MGGSGPSDQSPDMREHAKEEIRSGLLDLSVWNDNRWIQRKVYERSFETIKTIHHQEDRW